MVDIFPRATMVLTASPMHVSRSVAAKPPWTVPEGLRCSWLAAAVTTTQPFVAWTMSYFSVRAMLFRGSAPEARPSTNSSPDILSWSSVGTTPCVLKIDIFFRQPALPPERGRHTLPIPL